MKLFLFWKHLPVVEYCKNLKDQFHQSTKKIKEERSKTKFKISDSARVCVGAGTYVRCNNGESSV